MSHWLAPACQQSLVSSGFVESSRTLLPAAQHRSPLPEWCCCLCLQCSCRLEWPHCQNCFEHKRDQAPLWRQQSQNHLILLKMSHTMLLATPGWSNVSLLSTEKRHTDSSSIVCTTSRSSKGITAAMETSSGGFSQWVLRSCWNTGGLEAALQRADQPLT